MESFSKLGIPLVLIVIVLMFQSQLGTFFANLEYFKFLGLEVSRSKLIAATKEGIADQLTEAFLSV